MNNDIILYNSLNRKKRKRAFFLCFVYVLSLMLNLMPAVFAASPPVAFYNSLKIIHMDNPKWTYAEFCNKINDIANYTLSDAYNKNTEWINPYIYEQYDQLVVYGEPHGKTSPTGTTPADFFVNSSGRMFNTKSEKQGEYRHIGYNYGGKAVTNDYWHNTSYTGTGTFATKEDYTELSYTTISGASESWGKADEDLKNYILNSFFIDDDYITGGQTPFTLLNLWSWEFISEHVLIQTEPGIARSSSLKLVYNNGKNHNTLTIAPIDFDFSGNLTTDKNIYTISAGQNEVTVDVIMNSIFDNSTANMYLKDVEFSCSGDPKSVSVTAGEKNYKAEGIKKTFSRSNLQTGANPVKIEGIIQVNSNYKDFKSINVSKTITINVEENPDPWVTVIMTATPRTMDYTGGNMPVKLEIAYGISNIKNLNLINNIVLTVTGEGTFIKEPMLVGEHVLYTTILASYMSGYNERNKEYMCNVKYNMKDGTSYDKSTAAVVKIISNIPAPGISPTPTPTPIPINENSPPYVMLDAPASVKAGERFKVTAKGNDDDGDPLTYYWDVNYATTALTSTTYKYLWYNQIFSDTVQEVYCEVSDGEYTGEDVIAINIKEPTIDASMNVTGTLKKNRKITLNDVSQSPEFYPITNRLWTITPISGVVSANIKTDGLLTSISEDITIKGSGVIRVTLWVKNSAGYEATISKTLNIAEDLPPVADFSTLTVNFRDPDNLNTSTFEVTNKCYSPDNDKINKIILKYRYDSNNNGSFMDETYVNVYDGIPKNKILVDVSQVGKYEFYIEAHEEFGQAYISSYVTSVDKLKSDKSAISEVTNIAPIISYSLKEKKTIDIVLDVGKASITNLNTLESKLNQYLKADLIASGYNVNITVKNMAKSDALHNNLVYMTDDSQAHIQKLRLYDPIENKVSTIKEYTYDNNQFPKINNVFLSGDGYIYYSTYYADFDNDNNTISLYKINPLTKQTTFVKSSSSSYVGIGFFLGHNNVFYSKAFKNLYDDTNDNFAVSSNGNQFSISNDYLYSYITHINTGNKISFPLYDDRARGVFAGKDGFVYACGTSGGSYEYILCYYDLNKHTDLKFREILRTGSSFFNVTVDYKNRLYCQSSYSLLRYTPEIGGSWISDNLIGQGLENTIYFNRGGYIQYEKEELLSSLLDNAEVANDITAGGRYRFYNTFTSLNPIKVPSVKESYTSDFWNTGSERIYISYHSDLFGHMFSNTELNFVAGKFKSDNVTYIGLGTDTNKTQNDSLILANDNNGFHLDNTDIDNCLITIKNYILNNFVNDSQIITKYVEVDQNLEVLSYYDDYENDPQYSIQYKYNHDPNYFENGLGYADNMGVFVTTPMLCFEKPGKYEMDISVRDNPKNNVLFDNYKLWSYPKKMNLYVHRPPVPVFTVSTIKSGSVYNVTYAENSYDLDHLSAADKGIVNKRWFYKESSSPTWIDGKLPLSTAANKTYQVKLEVMDMEFCWASSVQVVSTVPVNHNPIAQFYFKKNPASKYNYSKISDVIVDTSTDPNGDPITERKWTVKKGGIVQPNSVNTVLNTAGEGEYSITLEVKDIYNAWSAPYTQTLTVVGDITPPTLSLTPESRPWGTTNVSVTMNCADTGGSGLKEIRYLWTENAEFADGAFTTVTTTENISITQTADGDWYLYAQAIDKAGNASNIIKGGAYKIDKTAPTLLDYRVTGEDYRSGDTFWVAKNRSIDIYTKSLEQLSGMRYTYLNVPVGGNKANHNWTGSTTNFIELNSSINTAIIAAERISQDTIKGEYEVRFTLKGISDVISDLRYYFTDIVGNVRGYNNSGYKIGVDTLPPTITITPGQRDLGKTEITASVSIADSGSGVKQSKYIVSTSSTKPAAGAGWITEYNTNFNVEISGTGTWYLHVESVDNVGNVSSTKSGAFKVDLDGPVISANPINRVWDNSNVLITLTATEAYSALKEVRYSVTNNTGRVYGGWQHINANQNNIIEIIEDGAWYLHVEAEDIAGNITYTYFGSYRVDKEAPVLTMGYVGGARHISGNNYFARQGDIVTFWMQGVDALSGMMRIHALARDNGITNPYRSATYNLLFPAYNDHSRISINIPTITVNNGKTLRATFPYQVLTSGDYTYSVEGIADDLATYNRHGWVDEGYRLLIDNTPPVISADISNGTFSENVNVNLLSEDSGSGVKNISYAWSEGTATPVTGWNVFSSNSAIASTLHEGIWYLHVCSADNVDNLSVAQYFGPYEIVELSIDDVKIEGYWNHWRGQLDKFGTLLTNEPHRFLSLETVKITVNSSGADKIIIRFSPELEAMQYTDRFGNIYDYTSDFDLTYINFPGDSTFMLNPEVAEQMTYWEYTLPLANSSIDNDNVRLNPQYKMFITAYRGTTVREYVIDDIDITGNIYNNIYIQELK